MSEILSQISDAIIEGNVEDIENNSKVHEAYLGSRGIS